MPRSVARFLRRTDASHWVVLARDEEDFAPINGDERWRKPAVEEEILWTDDFSDILSVFYWD